MPYGEILGRSMRIVWRHPYMVLLALLAGASGGSSFNGGFNLPGGTVPSSNNFPTRGQLSDTQAGRSLIAFGHWIQANAGELILIGIVVFAVSIVIWVIGRWAYAALISAQAAADEANDIGLGEAWRAGRPHFVRMLLFDLLLLAAGLVAATPAVMLTIWLVTSATAGSSAAGSVAGAALLLALYVFALLVAALVLAVPLQWARVALVLESLGPWAAIKRGWHVFTGRLGTSIIFFLLMIAVAIGAGIAAGVVGVVAAVPLLVVIGQVVATGTLNTPLLIVGLVIIVPVALLLGGAIGAYTSSCWTLAFRRIINPPAPTPAAAYANYPLSPDGRWWWDGANWRPTGYEGPHSAT